MKRHGNIYEQITSVDNLRKANAKASKGKRNTHGVRVFERKQDTNLLLLHEQLINKSYRTSAYSVFKVYEPKERDVYRLPYYPDRITHHAIMNIMEPLFVATFTADSYSCIKGKGIHAASFNLRRAIKQSGFKYCLKLDVVKFYPSVNHQILKAMLRRKFKDKELLWLLDEIIDSAPGLPIGNYLSQYLANFYLSRFDHWVKEELGIKHYFRYCDDLVFLGPDKPALHKLRILVTEYLDKHLKLAVKENYRVFPVSTGIDFVGYVHYPTHTLLRKTIKKSMARAVAAGRHTSVASYYGWAKHCDSKNLLKKLRMTRFSDLGISIKTKGFEGDKIQIHKILNKEVKVLAYEIKPSKFTEKGNGKCLYVQLEDNNGKRVLFTGSVTLMDLIEQVPKHSFPFTTTIVMEGERLIFT